MAYQPQGRKEVVEAVVIAALSAAVSGLVGWGLESLKAAQKTAAEKAKGREDRANG